MTTSQQIIDRATALLEVRTSGVSFVVDDANKNADAFIALQRLISEWVEDQVLNIPAPSLVSDALDVPPGTVRALDYNLAMEIAPEFGVMPSQVVVKGAEETKDRLESDIAIDLSVDMSDLAFTFNYDIERDN